MALPDIVGLDLSLTSTGAARGEETIVIKPKSKGAWRLKEISDEIVDFASMAQLAVIEAFSFLKGPAVFIPELHGVVKMRLECEFGIPYVVVNQAALKKFGTGNGHADKAAMILAAERRFGFKGESEDEADAWLLKCMGIAKYTVVPPWPLTIPQLEAVENKKAKKPIEWPELVWEPVEAT